MPDNVLARLMQIVQAKSTPRELAELLADSTISKALTEAPGAMPVEPIVLDQWQLPRTTPATREEVKVGPEQAASGGDAHRMTSHYSDPDPQSGITKAAERLGEELTLMRTMVKSVADQVSKLTSEHGVMKSLVLTLAKGQETTTTALAALSKGEAEKVEKELKEHEKDDEKKHKEEMEKSVSSIVLRATGIFDRAENAFAKADTSSKTKASELREEAVGLLGKAYRLAKAASDLDEEAVGPRKLMKSIRALAKSEDVENQDIWPDGKRPGDDKEGTGKAGETGTGTAKSDPPALAAPPPAAVAAGMTPELQEQLAKALSGQAVLTTTINQMYEMLGRSAAASGAQGGGVGVPQVAALFKADPDSALRAKVEEIGRAQESGHLSEEEAHQARNLASTLGAVAKGIVTEDIFTSRLRFATPTVRALFPDGTQAAA